MRFALYGDEAIVERQGREIVTAAFQAPFPALK